MRQGVRVCVIEKEREIKKIIIIKCSFVFSLCSCVCVSYVHYVCVCVFMWIFGGLCGLLSYLVERGEGLELC